MIVELSNALAQIEFMVQISKDEEEEVQNQKGKSHFERNKCVPR